MSREASRRLGVEKGIVDLSLAPTPAAGDSVAKILEIIGVGECGGPGTTGLPWRSTRLPGQTQVRHR